MSSPPPPRNRNGYLIPWVNGGHLARNVRARCRVVFAVVRMHQTAAWCVRALKRPRCEALKSLVLLAKPASQPPTPT